MNQATKLLTQYVVCEQLGISRPTLWRRRKDDPAFPQPVYIGPRAVRFKQVDVEAYIERLLAKGLTIPSYERGVARLLRYDRHP